MRKAGDILSSLFSEKFDPLFLRRAKTTAGLFGDWESLAAEAGISSASAHSRIAELERGIIMVEAEHPGWVQILQTKQSQLLSSAQKRYPELAIRGIAFRLSRDSSPYPAGQAPAESEAALSGAPPEGPPLHSLPTEPVSDEAYLLSKKRLEESIKRRNKLD
jgi:hypothetical protein